MVSLEVMKVFEKALMATLPALLLDTVVAAGTAASWTARQEDTLITAQVVLAFDKTNPVATFWAQTKTANLIKGISPDAQLAIRNIMGRAFEEGMPPRQAAKLIGPMIGLSDTQMARTWDKAEILAKGDFNKKVTIGQKLAEKGARKRALMVARTETIAAANEGQRIFWLEAQQQGLLLGSEKRVWIVTPDDRLCPICEAMDGQLRGLSDAFESPETGDRVMGPPIHPNCRCAVGLTSAKETPETAPDLPVEPIRDPISSVPPTPTRARLSESLADDLADETEKIIPKLTEAERFAISDYTGDGAFSINRGLRSGLGLEAREKIVIRDLKKAINKVPKRSKPVTSYRGLSSPGSTTKEWNEQIANKFRVGNTVELSGFQSTSIDPGVAIAQFSRGSNSTVLEFRTKRGLFVEPLSDTPGEMELLLNHNTRAKVIEKKIIEWEPTPGSGAWLQQEVIVLEVN